MSQTLLLLLGVVGLAGLGSLMSSNDDDHGPDTPPDPYGDRDVIEGDAEGNPIVGTPGDDAIIPYEDADYDDHVDGQGGDDMIWTGEGNDTVVANPGDDIVYLGEDDDLYGAMNTGADEGHDTIIGGSGHDVIITNGGEHRIFGDGDPDDVDNDDDEAKGNDSIYDNGGTVYVDAGRGDDLIWSPDDSHADAPDSLYGGEGNDTIYAGGNDIIDGGKGSDLYILRGESEGTIDITYGGADSIQIALSSDYTGGREYELVQDGDHVRLVLDGKDLALLRDTDARDVRGITFINEDDAPKPPAAA